MKRQITGDSPELTSRYFVGRCTFTGIIRILDFERACEIPLTIKQMATLAANSSKFGITKGGYLSVGSPEDNLRGTFIELEMKKMHMHGYMSNDVDTAFSQLTEQVRITIGYSGLNKSYTLHE